MTRPDPAPEGALLKLYLGASHAIPLVAPALLRHRLQRGKEDPARWREKLGEATQPRPEGRLIWLHAVGLGEVLALRGLILALAQLDPTASFLVTSSARSSAQVIGANLPPGTRHQYLPLDAPLYITRFLDHWRPALSIWAEQELWPGAIARTHARGIPLALVNARLSAEGLGRRQRLHGLYRAVFARLALIAAQDEASAERLRQLGAAGVRVTGSLKSAAPPLAADPAELARLQRALAGRRVWVAASTHPGDEAEALAAQHALFARDPAWLLILAPRDAGRAGTLMKQMAGLTTAQRSAGQVPGTGHAVWLADTYGELGLWYRLAERALIGGGFGATGGHNPWEAACLDTVILHGPDVDNFADDYRTLHAEGAAFSVVPGQLTAALRDNALAPMAARAMGLSARARHALLPLARDLLALPA